MAKKGQTAGMIIGGLLLGGVAAVTGLAAAQDQKHMKEAKRELHKRKDLIEQKKQYDEHGQILYFDPSKKSVVAFLGFHNKYVSAFKNGGIELKAENVGENEIFVTVPLSKDGGKIGIKMLSADLYLGTDKTGKTCLKPHLKEWEQWLVEKDASGMFGFKSAHFGKYLCAQGNGKLDAGRVNKSDWETWRMVIVQGKEVAASTFETPQQDAVPANHEKHFDPRHQSVVALLGHHNKYASGFKDGATEVKAQHVGENEIFVTVPASMSSNDGSKIGFKLQSAENQYLGVDKHGKTRIVGNLQEYETWRVEKDASGKYSFKSHFGKYLCAQPDGKLSADKTNKDIWEKWRVQSLTIHKENAEMPDPAQKEGVATKK